MGTQISRAGVYRMVRTVAPRRESVLVEAGNFGSETPKRGGDSIELNLLDLGSGVMLRRIFVDHIIRSKDA